jgi:MarR family transcriptional regulator for hemolysin
MSSNRSAEMMPNRRRATAPNLKIGFLVHDVSRMRRTLFDQEVKQMGITRAQWWALANLSRHEQEGMIQSDLARLLDVGKVTVGGLIDRLEASGYVNRKSDDHDRRIKRIFITELGYSVIDRMAEVGRRLNGVIMRGITLDHIHIAEDVMQAMKDNLRAALSQVGSEADAEDMPGETA